MSIDLPPKMQERVMCSIAAAAKYEIPANIVLAVAEKENGRPGQWVRNSNGTHDVGPLQFNTAYLKTLARYGITPADVSAAGCYSYDLAAWRLRQHIMKDQGDLWTRSANYHSRTPRFNWVYRADLMKRAASWADWLASHYLTHDVASPGTNPTSTLAPTSVATNKPITTPVRQTNPAYWKSFKYVPRKLLIDGQP